MNGPCAKARVFCTITAKSGDVFVGENWCANPQQTCPREPGEDYTKCATVCQQEGHAEQVAVRLAGDKAQGATAILNGHTYACRPCQEAMFGAGIVSFGIATPDQRTDIQKIADAWRKNADKYGMDLS